MFFFQKMDFHFLFQAFASLSFTIRYNLTNDSFQDFFIFQGNQSQAHFYRRNDEIKLYLNHKDNLSIYKLENISSNFWFSWPDFVVNDTLMFVVHQADIEDMKFTDFTFISPILEVYNDLEPQTLLNRLDNFTDINYGYFILIMIVVVIVIKGDARVVLDLLSAIKVKLAYENDYVSMKSVEITKLSTIQEHE